MNFTYKSYINLINLFQGNKYSIIFYDEYNQNNEQLIIRHDIDLDLRKAYEFAKLENHYNIKSTYFVMISSNFYNILNKESLEILLEILKLGHEIGLHFDETQYKIESENDFFKWVNYEKSILEKAINKKVKVFSSHRPSQFALHHMSFEKNSLINAYSNVYFEKIKYISDSRMKWRENVILLLESKEIKTFQLTIHPFWYSNIEQTIDEKFIDFFLEKENHLYSSLNNNISNFDQILSKRDIIKIYSKGINK